MSEYRYQLDRSSKKFSCPGCGKKRFVRFVDMNEDRYLPPKFGRCDREVNCSYFLSPYSDENYRDNKNDYTPPKKPEQVFIPKPLFKRSLSGYNENNFVTYLSSLFDQATVKELIQKYRLGTSRQLKGGCIFYQIDVQGNVRRGKIIVYNPTTGRRGAIHSVHSQLNIDHKHYPEWRFFGEHLLNELDKPVAIVESEKTAIIASVYFPDFIWLATGTISTLKPEYAKSLRGRHVTLFPDIGAYNEWKERMKKFSSICSITVSKFLECKADKQAKRKGYDLADYLVQYSVKAFR